jgi:hypothetical protein
MGTARREHGDTNTKGDPVRPRRRAAVDHLIRRYGGAYLELQILTRALTEPMAEVRRLQEAVTAARAAILRCLDEESAANLRAAWRAVACAQVTLRDAHVATAARARPNAPSLVRRAAEERHAASEWRPPGGLAGYFGTPGSQEG